MKRIRLTRTMNNVCGTNERKQCMQILPDENLNVCDPSGNTLKNVPIETSPTSPIKMCVCYTINRLMQFSFEFICHGKCAICLQWVSINNSFTYGFYTKISAFEIWKRYFKLKKCRRVRAEQNEQEGIHFGTGIHGETKNISLKIIHKRLRLYYDWEWDRENKYRVACVLVQIAATGNHAPIFIAFIKVTFEKKKWESKREHTNNSWKQTHTHMMYICASSVLCLISIAIRIINDALWLCFISPSPFFLSHHFVA